MFTIWSTRTAVDAGAAGLMPIRRNHPDTSYATPNMTSTDTHQLIGDIELNLDFTRLYENYLTNQLELSASFTVLSVAHKNTP